MNKKRVELVWFDKNLFDKNNQKLLNTFMKEYQTVQTIVDEEEFFQLIESRANRQVILIVSGQMSETVIPRVHNRLDILSIYVYCGNVSKYEYLKTTYSKVKNVTDNEKILLDAIHSESDLNKKA